MLINISKKNMEVFTSAMNEAANEQTKANKKRAIISTSICAGSSVLATAAAAVVTNVMASKKINKAQKENTEMLNSLNANMETCLATMANKSGYNLAEEVARFMAEQEKPEAKEEAKEEEKKEEEKKEETK